MAMMFSARPAVGGVFDPLGVSDWGVPPQATPSALAYTFRRRPDNIRASEPPDGGATPASTGLAPARGMFGQQPNALLTSPIEVGPSSLDPSTALPPAATAHPGFFQKGGLGGRILHGLGEFATNYSASRGDPVAMIKLRQRASVEDQDRDQVIWQRRHDVTRADDLADRQAELAMKANQPQYFGGDESRLKFDPGTGAVTTLYQAPTPAEQYAAAMGSEAGTDDYRRNLQDYTLRGYGETAMEGRSDLEAQRQRNRLNLRSTPTYANLHPVTRSAPRAAAGPPTSTSRVYAPLLAKMAAGQPLTPAEQQVMALYHSGGRSTGGRRGAAGSLPTISSPAEAAKLPRGTQFRAPDGSIRTVP